MQDLPQCSEQEQRSIFPSNSLLLVLLFCLFGLLPLFFSGNNSTQWCHRLVCLHPPQPLFQWYVWRTTWSLQIKRDLWQFYSRLPLWSDVVTNVKCDLLLTCECGKLEAVDSTANISWASWAQCFQQCLVWDAHHPTALLRIMEKNISEETRKYSYSLNTKMQWQGFLLPFLPPELKFDSGPSSLWLEPLD